MSKQAIISCDIREVNPLILKNAIKKMLKHLNGTLKVVNANMMRFYCKGLSYYNITIEVVDQKIKIRGEESDVNKVKQKVEQYYEAMMFEELPNCGNVEVDKEDLVLTVEV